MHHELKKMVMLFDLVIVDALKICLRNITLSTEKALCTKTPIAVLYREHSPGNGHMEHRIHTL